MDPGVFGDELGRDPGGTLGAEGGVEFLLPFHPRFFLEGLEGPEGWEAGGVLGRDVPVETHSTCVPRAATEEYVLSDPEVEGVVLVARAPSVVVLEDAAAVASSLESDGTASRQRLCLERRTQK